MGEKKTALRQVAAAPAGESIALFAKRQLLGDRACEPLEGTEPSGRLRVARQVRVL